jgi:hypothetical protein
MIWELAGMKKPPKKWLPRREEIRETPLAQALKTEALIAECEGKIAGYAVFFTSYSTWLGRNGIYMKICMFPQLIAAWGREKHC